MGFHSPTTDGTSAGPKPACGYLLESMRVAGANRALVALRPGKWDIPAHLADGATYGLPLAYTVIPDSPGVPWTVQNALRFAPEARVLFGFPDIVFRPADALAKIEQRQRERGAEVVLGLFSAHRPEKMDMVALDPEARVKDIIIKPDFTELLHTWILAIWTPAFTAFLNDYLRASDTRAPPTSPELHIGDVIRAALIENWQIDSVEIPNGQYRDIGTPEELSDALYEFGSTDE